MKTNLFQLRLLFLSCVALLCGCADNDEQILSTDGSTLTVYATADGFSSADGVKTRASDKGYTTEFTDGDEIGVFAVKDGTIIDGCNNVELTYNEQGSKWEGTVYYYKDAEYFAYYPYDASMDDKTSVDDIVNAFEPQSDQSTYANYTKNDLMTTTQNASPGGDKTLSFSFAHKMSLIEISLPVQRYTTGGASPYEYSSPVLGATFSITKGSNPSTITPYNISKGIYRYIVPAGTSTVSGTFSTVNNKTIEYSEEVSSLSAGSYKRLNVSYDGAPSETEIRSLNVGDFYYSDGSICPFTVSNPPREGCIGVVLKAGKDSDTDWKDDCTYKLKDGKTAMNTVHGYVLALYDANNGRDCPWGSYGTQVEYKVDGVDMMNREQNKGFYGYKNTQAVILFATDKNKTLKTDFPAVYWVTDNTEGYEYSYPAPTNSSGWFLPSAGQCKYWLNNKGTLLDSVRKVTGNSSYDWNNKTYWSSSEKNNAPTTNAWTASFRFDGVYGVFKIADQYNSNPYVRACLAF